MVFNIVSGLDFAKLIVSKINLGLMWIANFVGTKANIDPINIYYILVIAISLYVSRKIMLVIYASGEKGRTEIWLIIAAVIGGLLYFLK